MAQPKQTDTARYDRQLRLWGEAGQSRLEESSVCLINVTATGTETLKNLVLPGIGSYTIIDGGKITEADLGNNFFLDTAHIGQSRASVACELLQELNPLVKGNHMDKDPVQLITSDINFFSTFTHIIVTDLIQSSLLLLSTFCWQNNIPLFVAKSYGFFGYLRIQVPEHTVVESKPDNPADDLRIAEPFPELAEYADKVGSKLETMNSTDHSHTPYIVLLLKYLKDWKDSHNGKLPETRQERDAFKSIVAKGAVSPKEENFVEAYRAAHKAWTLSTIPSNTRAAIEDPKCNEINSSTPSFWILSRALRDFVNNEGGGKLPLQGTIPDMTATTEAYIELQKIYQEKATTDFRAICNRVKALLTEASLPENHISEDEIKLFCKNANFLQVVRFRSIHQEYFDSPKGDYISQEIANADPFTGAASNMNIYVALRVVDAFRDKHKRYPGDVDSNVQSDLNLLKEALKEVNSASKVSIEIGDDYLKEMARYGGCELHNMAALMGGVASQEVIKIITKQYYPNDNTFIFNGLQSTTNTYCL